jgi:hypothetical protein
MRRGLPHDSPPRGLNEDNGRIRRSIRQNGRPLVRAGDVKRILRRYDLPPAPVRCIARVDNVVDRVGRDHALRIYDPFHSTTPQIRSTLLWLEALARDTDVGAPAPRRNDAGELLTHTDDGRRCALLSWVEGRRHARVVALYWNGEGAVVLDPAQTDPEPLSMEQVRDRFGGPAVVVLRDDGAPCTSP